MTHNYLYCDCYSYACHFNILSVITFIELKSCYLSVLLTYAILWKTVKKEITVKIRTARLTVLRNEPKISINILTAFPDTN